MLSLVIHVKLVLVLHKLAFATSAGGLSRPISSSAHDDGTDGAQKEETRHRTDHCGGDLPVLATHLHSDERGGKWITG